MKFARHLLKLLLLLSAAVPALAQSVVGIDTPIVYSGTSVTLVKSNTPANNILQPSGNNTFILAIAPPTNALRVAVTNDTANSCANFSFQIFATSNPNVTSFSASTNLWYAIGASGPTGTFTTSAQTFTLGANQTLAFTTAPIVGTRIAIQLFISAACATTNFEAYGTFGTFAPATSSVQGTIPPGQNASTVNPLICGSKDSSTGLAFTCESLAAGNSELGVASRGLSIGGPSTTFGASFQNAVRFPGGSTDGPIAVTLVAPTNANGTNGGTNPHTVQQSTPLGSTAGQPFMLPGLDVADTGSYTMQSGQVLTISGSTQSLWTFPQLNGVNTNHSSIQTCRFEMIVTAVSGTTPTLDAYVQDSNDNSHWDDRIHFTQVTTAPTFLAAGIAGTSANETVHPVTGGTIAAGTIISGPLGAFGRVVFIITGTSPSFTLNFSASCK